MSGSTDGYNVVASGYRYVTGGVNDFQYPYVDSEESWLTGQNARASIGVSADGGYLFLGVADSNWDGLHAYEWAMVLVRARTFGSSTISVSEAWRMDEGGTTQLAYWNDGAASLATGSLGSPDPTIHALAVYLGSPEGTSEGGGGDAPGACSSECASASSNGWYCGSATELCWCYGGVATAAVETASCERESDGTHDHDAGEAAPCVSTCSGAAYGSGFYCCEEDDLLAYCSGTTTSAVTECSDGCFVAAPGVDDTCL